MRQSEMNEVVWLHGLWAKGRPEGVKADLRGANLQGADLRNANLQGADLRNAILQGADLAFADLQSAHLGYTNLKGVNLQGADLWCAGLTGADLSLADLWRADLTGANLRGANLCGANLTDTKLNWDSHNLLSEVLRQAAGHDIAKLSVAGLIRFSTHLCWKEFIELNHELQPWVFAVLSKFEDFEENV